MPALRPTFAGQISDLGTGGPVKVDPILYRATWDNRWIEDITPILSGRASIVCDPEDESTWNFNATITYDGWRSLTPYLDWVAPSLKVYYPDGTIREGQLGLYLVLDSGEDREETTGTVKLDCRDPLWLLGAQGFTGKLHVLANTDRIRVVKNILESAVLTGGDDSSSSRRYVIPDSSRKFKRAREWPRSMDRLEVINEILTGTGFYPLWTKRDGFFTTRRRGVERLLDREAVRAWHANVPRSLDIPLLPGFDGLDPDIATLRELPSEVVGAIHTTPHSADQINEIIIVNDDPNLPRIHVKRRAKNKRNRRDKSHGKGDRRDTRNRGGDKSRKINHPLIDDDATAEEVAFGLLDELGTRNSTATLTVFPDPEFIAIRDVIKCGVWDENGRNILYGKYLVHRVEYGFTPDDALMKIDIGAVEDSSDEGD